MPKKTNKQRYRKQKVGKHLYAVTYINGKRIYLGHYGSPEADAAYDRVKKEHARLTAEKRSDPTFHISKEEKNVTLDDVAAAFLDYAEKRFNGNCHYECYRTALEFAIDIYGHLPVDEFSPLKLKTVREEIIRSKRFCRNIINRNVGRILTAISWGVENELVDSRTIAALREVKPLPKGTPDTFNHKKRGSVPVNVIQRTLPYLPPTLRAMVVIQWLTGCRPSEIFNMRVGEIDQNPENAPGLWYYKPAHHKTERFDDDGEEKIIPLGLPEQELLAPYLLGKKPTDAVFSPKTAMEERHAEKRSNRKTKVTKSQQRRDDARAKNPKKYNEFYDRNAYLGAIKYAIDKANRNLKDGEKPVPNWFPYGLRHSAGTEITKTEGKDRAQHLLGHASLQTTNIYDDSALEVREELARKRMNPFDVG